MKQKIIIILILLFLFIVLFVGCNTKNYPDVVSNEYVYNSINKDYLWYFNSSYNVYWNNIFFSRVNDTNIYTNSACHVNYGHCISELLYQNLSFFFNYDTNNFWVKIK